MCTVVVLSRPGHAWPLLLAANRDERLDRAWDRPFAWPDPPGLVAGRDHSGGGTWMGLRGTLVATVLNRPGTLGPAPGKRSRGELPLVALRQDDAAAAARALCALNGAQYRSFNAVCADPAGAVFVRGLGEGAPEAMPLAPGLHMVTAHDPDDPASPRVARHAGRFRDAAVPEPPDWSAWARILLDASGPPGTELHVPPRDGFATVCSSLLAISRDGRRSWLFARRGEALAPVRLDVPHGDAPS